MTLYHLPHGQYGYNGHIINLPQQVTKFAHSLPRLPADLDIVIVRKEGADTTYRDFQVRRSVVHSALQWLMENNLYYQHISLDDHALALLPENGNLPGLPSIVQDPSQAELMEGEQGDSLHTDDPHFTQTFVPINHQKVTEEEAVKQTVDERQQLPTSSNPRHVLMWPPCEDTPVNEFSTEGYFTCAFPTLFPTGAADFAAPRPREVTIGNYFKHLMQFEDGRFAKHPRFRYFALNTEMRRRALQTGQVYIRQHPEDARLTVDELRDMIGQGGDNFSNRVLHYASTLRGTRQYWFQQRCRLISMVETLGLPTIFFTHSAADLQWPELARLMCPQDPESSRSRSHALIENPALADWFFYERIQQFIKAFYVDVLGVTDYWMRFEWQHRGSPHVHGLAWLPNAPDVEQILASANASGTTQLDMSSSALQELIQHVDSIVSTQNPAVLPDGRNLSEAPPPQTTPHICNKAYADVNDLQQDLIDLIATCQRHTRCSAAYCLRTRGDHQQCRFGYPKPLQLESTLSLENGDPVLLTSRNDGLVNGHNPVQLTAWRGNVDVQYCVSRRKVVEYCAKYATKCEPRSQPLKELYSCIVQGLHDGDRSLKAVQKLLISTVGERDFSAQETCHLLLQLPMFKASRDFIVLSIDGSRAVEQQLHQGQPATAASTIDHYLARPSNEEFEQMTLMHFFQNFTMPKDLGGQPSRRTKAVVVIVRPYCSPHPDGPKYNQYCQQRLMLHRPFRRMCTLLAGFDTYADAYADFLLSGNAPPSLEDDISRLQHHSQEENEEQRETGRQLNSLPDRAMEEWMILCQLHPQLQSNDQLPLNGDWTEAARAYPNIEEAATFVARQKVAALPRPFTTTADPQHLKGKQRQAYDIVQLHHSTYADTHPLHMIISGTAGTGKSYLICCLRLLLQDCVRIVAPTGVAAFNVNGTTLHSLLDLPTRGEFKNLQSDRLQQLQQRLAGVRYMIIDEMSMVGRKLFGQVDSRLRQAFPHHSHEALGGCSCLLFGDFGQLPPVMDLPLYTVVSRSLLSDLGRSAYQLFDKAIVLDQILRQCGEEEDQMLFRDILIRLRNAELTITDWQCLMEQTPARVTNLSPFTSALHLYPTVEAVVQHNLAKLRANGHPIATINAVHSGPNASKASADDAAGLMPLICIAHGARVMLTSNLWVEVGLVNGAMGTVAAICYCSGGPPDLPVAVMVHFDSYSGPALSDATVPIIPLRRTWFTSGGQCSRLQLPLKLAWAVTIHKAQGLTLSKVVIDVGKKEFCSGLTFVGCSRVRHLCDMLFDPPFPYQRVANLANGQRLQERQQEDTRLQQLQLTTAP